MPVPPVPPYYFRPRRFLGGVLLLIGLLAIGWGGKKYIRYKNFLHRGILATAVLVDPVAGCHGRARQAECWVIGYKDSAGKMHENRVLLPIYSDRSKGRTIKILYDPNRPNDFILKAEKNDEILPVFTASFAGLLMVIIGIGELVRMDLGTYRPDWPRT